MTIGREPSSDIPVHSEDVSRSHAYLLRTPQGFLLVDSSLHAMGLGSNLLGWGPGIMAGKLVADLAFYLPVIWIYERRRRAGGVR